MKQIIIAVLAIVAIIGGAIALGGSETVTAEPSNNFYGQEEGIITVVEYGDFECPACAGFYPIVSEVKEQFADQVRFEFRHFPLVQIHANATAAHRAAQAASNQGKFWEMHDILYERQAQWRGNGTGVSHSGVPISSNNPTAIFEEYARELELDMDQFIADAVLSSTLAVINADVALAKESGYSSTPTFEIDGVQVEDTNSIASAELLAGVIQSALDAKNGADSGSSESGDAPASEEAPIESTDVESTTEEVETSGQ